MKFKETWEDLAKNLIASGKDLSESDVDLEDPDKFLSRSFYNLKISELENYIKKVEQEYGSVECAPSRIIERIIRQKEFLMEYMVENGF